MLELTLAFLLDLLIGDPVYRFHPARLMGGAIAWGEDFLRLRIPSKRVAGALLALGLPLGVFLAALFVLEVLGRIHPLLAQAAQIFGIYSVISVRDLSREGLQIKKDLVRGDLQMARRDLARIVGRDTETLEQKEILRASIETIAESTLDGIVAPLFYAAIGGAPLAFAYKAVNTLDSMIGHLNERYRDFGFAAAKQDELWNWIPARLSFGAIAMATFFVNGRGLAAAWTGWKDGISKSSGNGSLPEAAFAGALGVQLGGLNTYEGRVVEKPFLGFPQKEFELEDLSQGLRLMMAASWISLFGALALKCLLS